jgi:lipopolysaccharide export LptBFGC system permease protein LptF
MRISFTLSRYIFADLLRIFLMASGALAGIMSFGGLLRPLTQQGLDATQVGQLLTYFTPAMTAYSFPIAALFATTMVYGRLSADNELTACRAAGISLLSVAVPAFVLGAVVALVSLLFLWFVVPMFTLKAERVIYSNIAKVIASRIDRSHQMSMGQLYTVFAQGAYLPPAEELGPGEQQVILLAPTIVSFERPFGKEDWHFKVPKDFFTASQATAYIFENDEGQPELTVRFSDGATFPRDFKGAVSGAVEATQFGPVPIPSPIKENTKFMNLRQLRKLHQRPQDSRKIQDDVKEFLKHDQEFGLLALVAAGLNGPGRHYVFQNLGGEEYVLSVGPGATAEVKGSELVIGSPKAPEGSAARPVRVQKIQAGVADAVTEAREARLRAWPRRAAGQVDATLKLEHAATRRQAADGTEAGVTNARAVHAIPLKLRMPDVLRKLDQRPLEYYVSPAAFGTGNQNRLQRQLIVLKNDIISEMHGRMAFALSCLILVLVGCALGMMFRSGNFLTAFAVSFVPALLSITLIIAGQQTCGNIPWQRGPNWENPLGMGVALIWSGNVANLALATGLLWRLWRT